MAKNLVIVESPAKAKTISKYLGKDFTVKSSFGHVRDLDKGVKGVDIGKKFKPKYVVSPEKRKVVKALKEEVKKANTVWLATDEDREGEAISWHLCEVLGLDDEETKRIVFHEITKPAILKAIENPRTLDRKLVNAQQARRILDRLVGFELSELLWRKVKGKLSAGRVQSVAVKLVVEREKEILAHKADKFIRISGVFNKIGDGQDFKGMVKKKIKDEKTVENFLNACKTAQFKVVDVEKKPQIRKPAPPFTTSTLQQDASRKLRFNVKKTMQVAQSLYENGHITYMRTDSISLSKLAASAIHDKVRTDFGENYVKSRQFKTKSKGAQEAHEAIRPTYIDVENIKGNSDQMRLYELIWKRTIASQMSEAKFEKTVATIELSPKDDLNFVAEGEVLVFDGFLKVYTEATDDDNGNKNGNVLPALAKEQILENKEVVARERFTQALPRYTEASLVKKLEEKGIGRPSTYAPTISKIMEEKRGYIVRESRPGVKRVFKQWVLANNEISTSEETENFGEAKNRLFPTDTGIVVVDFLSEHFPEVMNYDFTASIEAKFDLIADGKQEWTKMLDTFYHPFHAIVEKTQEEAGRVKAIRELGKDPETGWTVMARFTRVGPVIQIGTVEEVGEEGKPKFANLGRTQSIESITMEEAMELFRFPLTLGELDGKEIIVAVGRFGPYVKYDEEFTSIPRSIDPLELTLEQAIVLIEEKKKLKLPITQYQGKDITKGRGRFGPFLKWGDLYVNVPKRYDFANLSQEDALQLLRDKIDKEANRYIHRWEDIDLSVQNGRWGPFIKFGKKNVPLPKVDGKKMDSDQAKTMTLEEVKKIVEQALPGAFSKAKDKPKAKPKARPKKK